jgi:hypothetical protein
MKMSENRAVIETAMFMTLVATLRSAAIAGLLCSEAWRPKRHS